MFSVLKMNCSSQTCLIIMVTRNTQVAPDFAHSMPGYLFSSDAAVLSRWQTERARSTTLENIWIVEPSQQVWLTTALHKPTINDWAISEFLLELPSDKWAICETLQQHPYTNRPWSCWPPSPGPRTAFGKAKVELFQLDKLTESFCKFGDEFIDAPEAWAGSESMLN